MHKYFLHVVAMAFMVLFLLAGCTESPVESAENVTINENIETTETTETGKCVITPPTEPVACTMQYDPVCGCDGKTYGNACMARGAGVPDSTPGACEENPNL